MKSPISTRGKNKSPRKPKKKYTINDLSENDREVYQDIMETVLRRSGIDPAIIFEELKQRKQELEQEQKRKQELEQQQEKEPDKDKIEN
ncbi:hypothetical protein R7V75_00055 [Mesomycoplasma ovipneumoniae]|uniref:Uncharacterized protein n=1 Tax=Mesomycoplasma ovipneumoniae TaxID=29562 RepID=A0AAJ2P3M7_9BACT|nr:hypothetical protein [Mesomycoplasma ovipneumoniae]MDW2829893.1 hypothetical protein [Mesomycoplasma ovipneumoniae]MDW2834620.1 hypothetical protein [Mesomycoplasma ovipneumoniae]MDW2835376.1 hypothetical protein [Mesomycoplasma ovipneumoniae]MDW2852701.1 hypothetical protein [Mesomycoplasma ovipneumoniae]MDW2860769.1 hypothetical protein [Mesomycoplasma ovipneumoniae]